MRQAEPTRERADDRTDRAGPIVGAWRRIRRITHEMGKFLGVGVVAYLVDMGLFNLAAYGWHFDSFSAKLLSASVAATVAFCGNRFWTWRHRPRSGLRREYPLYFVFNAIGLGVNLACIGVYQLALPLWPAVLDNPLALNIAANVLGVGLGSLFRFYAYRTWVFPHRPPTRNTGL